MKNDYINEQQEENSHLSEESSDTLPINVSTGPIHYIYKIHFLKGFPSGRYYIGKRTFKGCDIRKDPYTGSGQFCFAYFRKYGTIEGETYIKEILEINPSKKINGMREAYHIGDKYKTDPLCMNLAAGDFRGNTVGANKHKIRQYTKDGKFIKEWDCINDAECTLGINNVSACCNRRRHFAGGFIWRYSYENIKYIPKKERLPKQARAVEQYSLDGSFIARFDTIRDAVDATGVDKKSIQECCIGRQQTGKGFIWKYVDPNYIRPCNRDLKVCGAKIVEQYDLNGNLLGSWESIYAAARALNVSRSTIFSKFRKNQLFNNTKLIIKDYA